MQSANLSHMHGLTLYMHASMHNHHNNIHACIIVYAYCLHVFTYRKALMKWKEEQTDKHAA